MQSNAEHHRSCLQMFAENRWEALEYLKDVEYFERRSYCHVQLISAHRPRPLSPTMLKCFS